MNQQELQAKANELSFAMRAFPNVIKFVAFSMNILSGLAGLLIFLISPLFTKVSSKKAFGTWSKKYPLDQKRWLYISLQSQVADQSGFIEFNESDCLMFSGLYSAGGGDVDLRKAQTPDGRWWRKPSYYKNWYPQSTASTISRDMMMGVFWHIWINRDAQAAVKTFQYGYKNHWIMGEGDVARIYLTPGLQATLAQIILSIPSAKNRLSRLELIRCYILSKKPQVWPTGLSGYQLHLDLLHIALRGELLEHIDRSMVKSIEDAVQRERFNPMALVLYSKYIDGDYDVVSSILSKEQYWPSTRLPTSTDRSEQWLPQRAFYKADQSGSISSDWLPDPTPPPVVYSGGDFMFVWAFTRRWIDESNAGQV